MCSIQPKHVATAPRNIRNRLAVLNPKSVIEISVQYGKPHDTCGRHCWVGQMPARGHCLFAIFEKSAESAGDEQRCALGLDAPMSAGRTNGANQWVGEPGKLRAKMAWGMTAYTSFCRVAYRQGLREIAVEGVHHQVHVTEQALLPVGAHIVRRIANVVADQAIHHRWPQPSRD